MIIDHNHPEYRKTFSEIPKSIRYNGAFYYSKEIVKNIIPNVKTDRDWVTIKAGELASDGAIIFIHNNLHPERYDYLKKYKDLILVCGIRETCNKVRHLGTPIYIPLSIDVDYVKRFEADKKTKEVCYVGRKSKLRYDGVEIPKGTEILANIKRQELLPLLAKYRKVYAVGRSALEAKCLGCEVLPYDPRYPDPDIWRVIDNHKAAQMLQIELDRIGHQE